MNRGSSASIAAAALILVAFVYWPVIHGDFVWDDIVNFRWHTWLTEGDQWKHYIFRDFNYWKYYFRPLVVGLFTLQLRLFDGAPGPMHAVSLTIHLANTLLVGWLALRCCEAASRRTDQRAIPVGVSMLLFGLHPAVIESVAWVGCQYDLLLTLFTLLGLLASTSLGAATRPFAIACCFFLAACTKESAIAFPLVLVLYDWAMQGAKKNGQPQLPELRAFVARNAPTWLALLAAGFAYLAFRHAAMGPSIMPGGDLAMSPLAHLQMVCSTYMRYWSMLLLPTAGMSPVHEFDARQFMEVTPGSLSTVAAAIGILTIAILGLLRRRSALMAMILIMTATLLPVLRILPAAFNPNLYHDRYLVCGLAVACAMVPLLRPRLPHSVRARATPFLLRFLLTITGIAWLATSVITIRSTIPLWANETTLWNWAYATDRNSRYAISNLLELHLAAGRFDEARPLADRVLNERIECPNCLMSIAALALHDRDETRAGAMLQLLRLNWRFYEGDKKYMRLIQELALFAGENRGGDSDHPRAQPPRTP